MSVLSQVLLYNYYIWWSPVSIQSLPDDPKATQLSKEIDDINKALDQCKIQILTQLRVPLDNCNPVQDLERRLKEYEVILIPFSVPSKHVKTSLFMVFLTPSLQNYPAEICPDFKKTGNWDVFHPERCGTCSGKESIRTHSLIPPSYTEGNPW